MNGAILSALLLPVETGINHALRSDPHSQRLLCRLAGKVVQVECSQPQLEFQLLVLERGIRLAATTGAAADVTVSGKASALMKLLMETGTTGSLANRGIEIRGDAALLQTVHAIARDLDLNWQDPLSLIVGPAVTGQLESLLHEMGVQTREISAAAVNNIDEFLHEEIRLSPPAAELAVFTNRLDLLRLRLDRTAARLRLLQQQLGVE